MFFQKNSRFLFSSLKNFQYYSPSNVSPSVLLTCEHASNELPEGYNWSKNDKKFENTHWSYDIGALELSKRIAQKNGIALVHSKYSRLFCDVNRPIASDTLFRKICDGVELDLNKNIDENLRIDEFYFCYYKGLREIYTKMTPKIALSMHSFTKNYENSQRHMEIGILANYSMDLAEKIFNEFKEKGYKTTLNEPWSGKEGFCYAVESLIYSRNPIITSGIVIEFRNDLLQNEKTLQKLELDMSYIINKIA